MKIALLPGGFKPPHLGHYNMAKYLADFADNVIVRIGQKEREGIGAPLALEVWNFYKEFDPDPRAKKLTISVAQSPSPVKDVYDFVEKIAPEGSTVILGLGEKDAADGRYNSIPKFAEPRNIKAEIELVPPQAGGISGTRMREIIKSNDKDTFFKYIPDYLPEEIKEEIWTKLVDTTMPTDVEERISFQSDIDAQDIEFIDAQADADMDPVDIDLTSQHFFDRLNDPRNYPNIELDELELFFAKLADKKEEFIEFLNQYKTVVAKDRQTDINIPFMKLANKAIAKTIMRKRNFQTPDPVLPLEEFMGGTMNKQEMEKHNANMKKLRKFFSKQSDQMVQVPTKLTKGLKRKLYERFGIQRGTIESETQFLSREIFELFKQNIGKPYEEEGIEGYIEGGEVVLEFEVAVEFIPSNDTPGFSFDAEADDENIEIRITYNPAVFPDEYNNLNAELKETLRHEIEHVTQFGFDLKNYFEEFSGEIDFYKYLMLHHEIPAFVRGLYKRAKFKKMSLSDAFDDFFEDYIDSFNSPQEIEQVKRVWINWAKSNLPAAQLDENINLKDFTYFETSQGSKYIRKNSTSQLRRIKSYHANTGGKDMGLHGWKQQSMFIDPKFEKEANSVQFLMGKGFKKIAVSKTQDGKIVLLIPKDNKWVPATWGDAYPNFAKNKPDYKTKPLAWEYIKEPTMGYHVVDFEIDSSRIIKDWHFGSPVSKIGPLSDEDAKLFKLKENYPPYKANQVQQVRYKASDTFTNDRKKAKKLGYLEEIDREELKKGIEVEKEHTDDLRIAMKIALDHLAEDPKYYTKLATLGLEEMKLFSKDWWLDIITEEILNEGGAAGHMAHPFDLPNVNTGKDLIKSFEQAAESLKREPGSVKIDGVNASIRLINNAGKREFAMDRGSKKALDLKGVTKADLEARFGAGHGMIKAGGDVLDIFNTALPTIQEELTVLGMWDNPNVMFNMEYVSGKSNVQDYGKNFLAIHGLLEVESKEVQGARGMLVKRVTSEKKFAQSDMDELLKKLEPFAKKKGFEIYGSVPTTFTKEPNFKAELGKNYTIDFAEGSKTKSLAQWLNDVTSIPKTDRLKMNIEETDSIKDVGALSKQVYFAVFGGENVDSLFSTEQEVQKAIQGATTYLATEKLGDAILDVLDSPMGSVNDHEGVVIRDPKISNRPFKITGKFITGGVSSQFQAK